MRNQYDPNDMQPDYGTSGYGRPRDLPSSMQRRSDMSERQYGHRFGPDNQHDRDSGSQQRDAYGRDGGGHWGFAGQQGGGDHRWQDNNQVRYGSDGYGEGAQGYYGGQQQSRGYHGQDQGQREPVGYHGSHHHDGGYGDHSGEASGMSSGGYGPGHSMGGLARYDQDYNPPVHGNRGPGGYRDYNMQSSGRHGMERGGTHQGPWGFSGGSDSRGSYAGPSNAGRGGFGQNWGYGSAQGDEHFGGMSGSRNGDRSYSSGMGGGFGQGDYGAMDRQGSGQRGFRGVGPRGYTRSDERLCEDINERLTDDDYIDASDISISTKDGEVTLSGDVSERRLKHYIEDLVERCHGVREIHNKINVRRTRGDRDRGDTSGSGNGSADNDSSSSATLRKK